MGVAAKLEEAEQQLLYVFILGDNCRRKS